MPLMRALADWFNREHEGWVERGQEFEASDYRAVELAANELAVYAVSTTEKIRVTADPPEADPEPEPEPAPEPDPPTPPRSPRRRK